MKRRFVFVFLFLSFLLTEATYAQPNGADKKQSFSAGIGFIPFHVFEPDVKQFVPPLYLKYSAEVSKILSLGVNLAYSRYYYEEDRGGGIPKNIDGASVLFRFNFLIRKGEYSILYFGIGVGYRLDKIEYLPLPYSGNYYTSIGYEHSPGIDITFGYRAYVSETVAIYIEAGLAKSVFQTGIVKSF